MNGGGHAHFLLRLHHSELAYVQISSSLYSVYPRPSHWSLLSPRLSPVSTMLSPSPSLDLSLHFCLIGKSPLMTVPEHVECASTGSHHATLGPQQVSLVGPLQVCVEVIMSYIHKQTPQYMIYMPIII